MDVLILFACCTWLDKEHTVCCFSSTFHSSEQSPQIGVSIFSPAQVWRGERDSFMFGQLSSLCHREREMEREEKKEREAIPPCSVLLPLPIVTPPPWLPCPLTHHAAWPKYEKMKLKRRHGRPLASSPLNHIARSNGGGEAVSNLICRSPVIRHRDMATQAGHIQDRGKAYSFKSTL